MSNDVLVVIGAGSIGQAIARRTGPGKQVLLADFNETTLQAAATALEDAGHTVTTQRVDVSDRKAVHALAADRRRPRRRRRGGQHRRRLPGAGPGAGGPRRRPRTAPPWSSRSSAP